MASRPKASTAERAHESLSIGALSKATGIPVETLRTWEQRYGTPQPLRRPSGHRAYPADTVEHLRRVARLLARGHRPGQVLRLPATELDRLLSLSGPAPATPAPAEADSAPDAATGARVERLLQAMRALDRDALTRELQSAWVRLGPLRFLEEVVGAFLVRVGEAWQEGTVEVRHEHFAFACIHDFLRGVREPFDQQARGPRVVAATLPGERHEGGLLMASVLMAVRGFRVLYLGLDTPADQVAAAARAVGAEAVVVSVSSAMSRPRTRRAVESLRGALPRRLPLWIGGAGAPPGLKGVERLASLADLDARLGAAAR